MHVLWYVIIVYAMLSPYLFSYPTAYICCLRGAFCTTKYLTNVKMHFEQQQIKVWYQKMGHKVHKCKKFLSRPHLYQLRLFFKSACILLTSIFEMLHINQICRKLSHYHQSFKGFIPTECAYLTYHHQMRSTTK